MPSGARHVQPPTQRRLLLRTVVLGAEAALPQGTRARCTQVVIVWEVHLKQPKWELAFALAFLLLGVSVLAVGLLSLAGVLDQACHCSASSA